MPKKPKPAVRIVQTWDAERVRKLRERFGETQRVFCHRLGVTKFTLRKIEQGANRVRPGLVWLLRYWEQKIKWRVNLTPHELTENDRV